MFAEVLSSILLLIIFYGFGLIFQKIINKYLYINDLLLIGLAISNSIVSIISIFFPINQIVLFIFLIISFISIKLFDRKIYWVNNILTISLLLIGLIISIGTPHNSDTPLYHLQSIMWIEKYKCIPGLANLHGRLGFNSNIFLINALSSLKFLFKQEIFSLNFTIFIIIISYLTKKILEEYRTNKISNILVFNLIIIITFLNLPNLSSPSPDYSFAALVLYVFLRIINSEKNEIENIKLISLFVISVYVITIKLSSFPILILFLFYFKSFKKIKLKDLNILLLLAALITIPWLIRNIILSGWLVYPFYQIDIFSFDWKVKLAKVISEKNDITAWARIPGPNYQRAITMSYDKWVPIWWKNQNMLMRVLIFSGIIFSLIAMIIKTINYKKIQLKYFNIITTSFLSMIFWFVMAPDIRFGIPFISISFASIFLILNFKYNKININYIFFSLVLFFLYNNRSRLKQFVLNDFLNLNTYVMPKKIIVPTNVTFDKKQIYGGFVNVPRNGVDLCYDCQVPCTTYYDSTLIFRGNSMNNGFKTK